MCGTRGDLELAERHMNQLPQLRSTETELNIERLMRITLHKFNSLRQLYTTFRVAFPDKHNDRLEYIETIVSEKLKRCLRNKVAHIVYHPYSVAANDKFAAIDPHI